MAKPPSVAWCCNVDFYVSEFRAERTPQHISFEEFERRSEQLGAAFDFYHGYCAALVLIK